MPSPRPKFCRWTLLPVFFAIGLIALASCKGEEPAANSKTRSRFRSSTVSVRVVPVREGRLTYTIYATGTAVPDQEINLSARIEGQVTQLDVREGDWVKAGQVLVVQDDAILRHQYQPVRGRSADRKGPPGQDDRWQSSRGDRAGGGAGGPGEGPGRAGPRGSGILPCQNERSQDQCLHV